VTNSSSGITKQQRVGLDVYFDNVWRSAGGLDLLFEPDADANLRALISHPGEGQLMFRPKADGINDIVYTNHNDWDVLAHNVCSGVVNPGGLVTDPIRC
jgi:hypothetical protein